MNNYVRLTYASTTTSNPVTIRQDLVAILNEAQIHNSKHSIYGVLFYGNDCFFQCLEGSKLEIESLYHKLLKDPRHKEVVLLSYQPVSKVRFLGWNMKYVLQEPEIIDFFESNNWEKFNPYALDEDLIEPFLNILASHYEDIPGEREEVVGREAGRSNVVRGSVLNYKYTIFIIIIALLILAGMYLIMGFNSVTPIPGTTPQ